MNVATPATNQPVSLPILKPLKIGPVLVDPPVLQAPMAGFTNYAFRQIVRDFGGVGLLATEMAPLTGYGSAVIMASKTLRAWATQVMSACGGCM